MGFPSELRRRGVYGTFRGESRIREDPRQNDLLGQASAEALTPIDFSRKDAKAQRRAILFFAPFALFCGLLLF